MTNRNKAATPRPTVRPLGHDRFRVTFPGIETAAIVEKMTSGDWSYRREGDACGNITWGEAEACARAWNMLLEVPKALTYSADEVEEMANAARYDSRACAKIVRTLLRERTGFAWSVTNSKSRTSGYIRIQPRKARAVSEFGYMGAHDRALLARILYPNRDDTVHNQGYLLSPDERAWIVRAICGQTIEAEAA